MRDLGLVECVNPQRKLWMWTHRANVLTNDSIQREGGKISLSVEQRIRESMAALMARGRAA